MRWEEELNSIMSEFMIVYCLTTSEMLAFLSTTLIGTMEMKGYSEEFLEKTLDRMRDNFNKKRESKGDKDE